MKGVNGILRELIETKSLIEQLKGKKRSPKAIEALEQEQAEEAKIKLRDFAEIIVDENYKGSDEGRKNELKNAMTQSLHTFADKITNGAKLEVRMIAPVSVSSDDGNNQNREEETVDLTELQILANTLDEDIESLCFNGEADVIKALLASPESEPFGVSP